MYILGISCYYHDSAAVLLKDGEILFASHEERYTRKKHDDAFPINAIQHALAFANITIDDVSAIGFYEKPFLKFFDRILMTFIKVWPKGLRQYHLAMQEWMMKKLWIPHHIQKKLNYKGPVYFAQHHESHAASAYHCSGFPNATIVTVDGVGEWATTTIGHGNGNDFKLVKELHYPHSLGLLYSALTYYLGFKVNSAEYKVMGLAPYGQPRYMKEMHTLIDIKEDGSFRLNMEYFTFEHGLTMTGHRFEELFGRPRRSSEGPLELFHKDIARSIQELTNELMLKICVHAKKICPSDYLCLAGGVALNCVANGKILKSGLFKEIFIQPAAGDAGGALGVALAIWHKQYNGQQAAERMNHVFLGSEYPHTEIKKLLREEGMPFDEMGETELTNEVAKLLEGDNVIGWYQGRSEFGPRSLGNRSIIADARNRENWKKVNLKIKFRESFRPFAPTVLEEKASQWFDLDRESPYMLLVADVHPDKREKIPAVTHVDGSARIQTIRRDQNPKYYDLIKAFEQKTGCPVIINTSFNVRGEPIVETPRDALNCFLHTQMDYLVMGNTLLSKKKILGILNVEKSHKDYLAKFELD
ncbi:carbamoyltransferase [Candidatus Peregrinibacteria bacterium]|nr:carbamoyltransferase [Candidatus Peregrinibacteria bacterium]